ncbi:MAG: hypothetical protein MUD12_03185 [Spirochaetes bacterium]|jgi:hypothetical protein|nr:hypothetical protein [Spirochaetota bacterium]
METTYYSLASKGNFNKALKHFFKVNDVVDDIDNGRNLADSINDDIDSGEIASDQILPIVGAVIRDKYGYSYHSYSLPQTVSDFSKITDETSKWTALDIVIVYYNPSGKTFVVNPKNPDHWEMVREIFHDQLAVIYVKNRKEEENKKVEKQAITAIEEMLSGRDVFTNKDFIDSTVVQRKPAPKPVAAPVAAGPGPAKVAAEPVSKVKKNFTPKYAVQVSNELFHNGNVEAWKKIVESFKTKFKDLDVYIFFEGELINDINALFKWGKVKHGDSIFFQVAGEDIKGVSKLQKYLFEGASPRFEQFLKIGVGQVLNLF